MDLLTRYCDRCKVNVPGIEWVLYTHPTWYFRHEGEMRGITSWDSEHDNRRCMFILHVPDKVA